MVSTPSGTQDEWRFPVAFLTDDYWVNNLPKVTTQWLGSHSTSFPHMGIQETHRYSITPPHRYSTTQFTQDDGILTSKQPSTVDYRHKANPGPGALSI